MRHSNQVAVVTGGSQGIGMGIAEKLAKEGAQVIIGARKPPVHQSAYELDFHPLDVASEESVAAFFRYVEASYDRLDVIVNAAGMMFQKPFLETRLADWDQMMAVNLRGVFICSQFAAKLMMKNQAGSIINIGSIEGMASNPEHTPYAASKAGVHGLSRAIAVDTGQYGLRCNTVCPGWIETPLNQGYFESEADKAHFDRAMCSVHPAQRLGTPEDVANMVSWLASDEAVWVTGQEFIIDGGRLARLSGVPAQNG